MFTSFRQAPRWRLILAKRAYADSGSSYPSGISRQAAATRRPNDGYDSVLGSILEILVLLPVKAASDIMKVTWANEIFATAG